MPSVRSPRRLKFSIALRLFGAVLLCFSLVGAVALELLRWQVFDNFAEHPTRREYALLDPLATALVDRYRQHQGWSFLPADDAKRQAWLRDEWVRVQSSSAPAVMVASANLGQRLALSDADHRPLAGHAASRLLVALASIDRFERPLVLEGRTIGHLVVAQPGHPDDELAVAFLLAQQRHLGVIALCSVLLSVLAAALLAAHFRRPIRQMLGAVRQVAAGRFDIRLPGGRSDELGELARAFNQLAAQLDEVETSRQQWMADTSHELRTPLAVLQAQLEALQDGVRPATPQNLALMQQQLQGLGRLVEDLSQLSQAELGGLRYDMQPLDLRQLAASVCAERAHQAQAAGLALECGPVPPPDDAWVKGDALRLRQLLGNLLDNSLRYTAAGGQIVVLIHRDGRWLHWMVLDSAPGVAAADRARLGQRFFRVEASRSRASGGSGLGLALCRRIAEAHGSTLYFDESPLGGLKVSLTLPLEPRDER